MTFKDQSRQRRFSLMGSVFLPSLYIVSLAILKDPDFLVFVLGPFGFIILIVQCIPFLIGGWPLAVMATILFLVLVGYLLGRLLGWFMDRLITNL